MRSVFFWIAVSALLVATVHPGFSQSKPPRNPSQTKKAQKKPPKKSVKPVNPFSGTISPKALPGQLPEPIWSSRGGEPAKAKGPLITTRLDVVDPFQAVRSLFIVSGQLGGTALRFDDTANSRDPEGIVLFIPVAKMSQAEIELAKLGSVVISSRTNGTNDERLSKVEEIAKKRISELEELRDRLLVHYLPGANPVQDTLEDLKRVQTSVSDLHRKPIKEGMAVFWVRFV